MIIVLFFSRGIMGDKELSFYGLIRKIRRRKERKATAAADAKGGDAQ